MTPEQVREASMVMAAFAEGKEIEFRVRGRGYDRWLVFNRTGIIEGIVPSWDWSTFEYRVKHERRVVWVHYAEDRSMFVTTSGGLSNEPCRQRGCFEAIEVIEGDAP